MSGDPQPLPEGLTTLAPGPALAAAVASVDLSQLAPADVFEVLAAQQRLVAHHQAQLLAALWEAGRVAYGAGIGPLDRKDGLDRFSADEAAFTLHWSLTATQSYQHLAEHLINRLPTVYAALAAGRIDLPKAWAFSSALLLVDDDATATIVERILAKAPTSTLANLQQRLAYWVRKLDPDAAARRHQACVADRRVYARLTDEGTAELGGTNLPPDRAAAAFDRVDIFARAAKADGDPRTLNQLRADAYLDLLSGVGFQTRPSRDPITQTADDLANDAQAMQPATSVPADVTDPGAEPSGDPDDDATPSRLLADADWLSQVGFTDSTGRPFTSTPWSWPDPNGRPLPVTLAPDVDPAWAAAFTGAKLCTCGGLRSPVRGGVHIQTKLSTLMCLDDDPTLIPGWGPVIADIARQVAFEQEHRPPWFWDVTDERGNLLHHGRTRRRPTPTERAFIQARDRTCRAPGCAKPAMACQQDHRRLHAAGGPSHRGNMCSLCSHHHALRHEHGYVFHHIHLGTYLMESASGRHWLVTPDADLILTAEDIEPGPPPGYVASIFGYRDDADYYADSVPAP